MTFVTDFGITGRHAYYYVALDRGYYREAGVDIEILRGTGSGAAIKQVAAGKADMGFADALSLVVARAEESAPVKEVAIVYQKPPHAFFILEESGIKTPKDLEGRTIADTAGSSTTPTFGIYARKAGIDASKVKFLVVDPGAMLGLLSSGQVAATAQYVVGLPTFEKAAAPKKLVVLKYSDVGMDFYANGIIASDDMIKNKPDTVKAVVAATVKGMRDAFKDPAEAGRILRKYNPEVDVFVGEGETREVAKLAQTPATDANGLGYIDPQRMRATIDLVVEAGLAKRAVTVEEVAVLGFTPKP